MLTQAINTVTLLVSTFRSWNPIFQRSEQPFYCEFLVCGHARHCHGQGAIRSHSLVHYTFGLVAPFKIFQVFVHPVLQNNLPFSPWKCLGGNVARVIFATFCSSLLWSYILNLPHVFHNRWLGDSRENRLLPWLPHVCQCNNRFSLESPSHRLWKTCGRINM